MGRPKSKRAEGFDERYEGVNYDPEIPDTIRLPDGREFSVYELLAKSRLDTRSGHIKTFRDTPVKKPKTGCFKPQYSEEETAWLLQATIEQVQERYKIDRQAALGKLRYVHVKVGKKFKVPERKPDRRTNPE